MWDSHTQWVQILNGLGGIRTRDLSLANLLINPRLPRLSNRLFTGMWVGAVSTFALEVFRIRGYLYARWIPMDDMIMLPGMLLTEKAPSIVGVREIIMHVGVPMHLFVPPVDALIGGALWHFWNGATFGIVYALLVGKGRWWCGLIWGFVVEIGMMPY